PDQPPRGRIIYVRLLVVACSDKQTAVWTEHRGVQSLLVLNSRENFPARYGIANPSGVQLTGQNPLTVRRELHATKRPHMLQGRKRPQATGLGLPNPGAISHRHSSEELSVRAE